MPSTHITHPDAPAAACSMSAVFRALRISPSEGVQARAARACSMISNLQLCTEALAYSLQRLPRIFLRASDADQPDREQFSPNITMRDAPCALRRNEHLARGQSQRRQRLPPRQPGMLFFTRCASRQACVRRFHQIRCKHGAASGLNRCSLYPATRILRNTGTHRPAAYADSWLPSNHFRSRA